MHGTDGGAHIWGSISWEVFPYLAGNGFLSASVAYGLATATASLMSLGACVAGASSKRVAHWMRQSIGTEGCAVITALRTALVNSLSRISRWILAWIFTYLFKELQMSVLGGQETVLIPQIPQHAHIGVSLTAAAVDKAPVQEPKAWHTVGPDNHGPVNKPPR